MLDVVTGSLRRCDIVAQRGLEFEYNSIRFWRQIKP